MLAMFLAASLALQPSPHPVKTPQSITPPPSPEQVLAIPDGLREALQNEVLRHAHTPMEKLRNLLDYLIDQQGFALHYQPNATLTIAETYRERVANCLTFTMLAVVLAREVGLEAYAQQLTRVFTWTVQNGVVTQVMHANVVVSIDTRKFVIDIANDTPVLARVDQPINDEHLLALYYGNRAMEFFADGDFATARLWLDTALRHEQNDATLWNNSGLLYQRAGKSRLAEELYLRAIRLNPNLTSALSNLIALYREQGRHDQTVHWQRIANRALRRDPYYQYARGQQQEQLGNYAQAADFFERAISLHDEEHRFHFALARTYFRLGELEHAGDELRRARELSQGSDRQRYDAKLDALRRISFAE